MKDLKSLNRVLLKLSGEALAGEKKTGLAAVISGEEEPARTCKEPSQIRLVCLQL